MQIVDRKALAFALNKKAEAFMPSMPTDLEIRAARELLRWDQKRLAAESDRSLTSVRRFETGQPVADKTIAKLAEALERAGVLFLGATVIEGIAVSQALALRNGAKIEPRPEPRAYIYSKRAGRPKRFNAKR